MIPLFLLQEITKHSIDKNSLFLQSLMTQHVTVQYDPNDMVVKLIIDKHRTINIELSTFY